MFSLVFPVDQNVVHHAKILLQAHLVLSPSVSGKFLGHCWCRRVAYWNNISQREWWMLWGADSLARGICQNPEFASSLEKTDAVCNCANVFSTDGIWWNSLRTLSLSLVRSTQIHTSSFFFGTTTSPNHQSVGTSTLEITPCSSILSSWTFTFSFRGRATRLGAESENGWALSFNLTVYCSSSFPNPVNSLGIWWGICHLVVPGGCQQKTQYWISLWLVGLEVVFWGS